MSFPRYPEYKDSGVDWLGEVPAHWAINPFYSLASERTEPNSGMLEDNLLSLSYGRIVRKNIESNDGLLPESFETYQIVKPGDIVFRLTDLQNDKRSLRTAIVEEQGIITSAYLAAKPTGLQSGYLSHLLRAYDVTKVFYSMGGGLRQSMKFSDIKRLPTLAPSAEEQTSIATFLDRETAKIDGLIAEQEKLIALLAEKRQATISHAVTKGLNPDAPLKDSGVAWLGEVPAHWSVQTLQRCVYVAEGQVNPELQPYCSMLLIAPNHIESGSGRLLYFETAEEQSAESGKYLCQAGDVIYSKIRPALRKVCIAPEACLCSADMYPMRGTAGLSNKFLMWFMLSEPFSAFAALESERVAMPKINRESLKEVWLSLPPPEEQGAISTLLDSETARLDALTTEATRGIALLKERRAALISAAVTGKIDVRNLAEQKAA